jgi:hypothetical protein
MPDENASNTPSANPDKQPLSEAQVPPAVEQSEVGDKAKCCTDDKQNNSIKLEMDIRTGERWLIGINAFSVIMTIVIALIYWGQLCQMRRATKAAEGANKVATDTLIASNRPWLDIQPTIKGPLTFDKAGAHLTMQVEMVNTGHSPAVRVITSNEFIQIINWNPHPWNELKKICDLAGGGSALETNRGLTQIVFPGKPFSDEFSFVMSPDELERKVVPEYRSPYIYPAVVWCTAYRSDFSDKVHRIGYIWNIYKFDPKVPGGGELIDRSNVSLRGDQLVIYKFPAIGPLAD